MHDSPASCTVCQNESAVAWEAFRTEATSAFCDHKGDSRKIPRWPDFQGTRTYFPFAVFTAKLCTAICGFIYQEIIQNADDAGAKTVKFYLDSRQHGRTSLVHPDLAPYQGPALLAYNDAQFTDEDWEGIQNLQRSIKAEDPFKVGKFGIGFNSVYHITGSTMAKNSSC